MRSEATTVFDPNHMPNKRNGPQAPDDEGNNHINACRQCDHSPDRRSNQVGEKGISKAVSPIGPRQNVHPHEEPCSTDPWDQETRNSPPPSGSGPRRAQSVRKSAISTAATAGAHRYAPGRTSLVRIRGPSRIRPRSIAPHETPPIQRRISLLPAPLSKYSLPRLLGKPPKRLTFRLPPGLTFCEKALLLCYFLAKRPIAISETCFPLA